MLRRLAALLIVGAAVVLPAAVHVAVVPAAAEECTITSTGIDCSIAGSSTSTTTTRGSSALPPLRYFVIRDGACWQWSRFPPGLDSADPSTDAQIIRAISRLVECVDEPGRAVGMPTSEIERWAWEIFRRFPLDPPDIHLQPPGGGITGLASYAWAPVPGPLRHHELLPDGTTLEVHAVVASVRVDWGDGTPAENHPPERLRPRPGGAVTHVYRFKTCPAAYRSSHPSGPNCHPTLSAYTVELGFTWQASYRRDGAWNDLGRLHRSRAVDYDIDEVVGVLG